MCYPLCHHWDDAPDKVRGETPQRVTEGCHPERKPVLRGMPLQYGKESRFGAPWQHGCREKARCEQRPEARILAHRVGER